MVCLKCGTVCQSGEKFCRFCGSELLQPEDQTVGAENGEMHSNGDATFSGLPGNRSELVCATCGTVIVENQRVCRKCGAAIGSKAERTQFGKGVRSIGANNGPVKARGEESSKLESIKAFEPFFENWYVESFIGSGSFGSVYKIYKEEHGQRLYSALKHISIPSSGAETTQLRLDGMDDASISVYYSELAKNISAEATLMNKLRGNDNIVSFEDSVTLTKPDGVGYDILIRMELLTPLPDRILSQSFSVNDVVKLSADICNALIECHDHGIIHRDIKPDNIFVSDAGDYKLGDFGIARQLEKTATFMSKKGTYNYMAPEVYVGDKYGANCDIYSLGLVMYRMLNGGRLPFLPPAPRPITPSERETSIVRRMKGEPLSIPAGADESLGAIVLKACAFSPAERYASAKEMKDDLILYAAQKDNMASNAPLIGGLEFTGATILDSDSKTARGYGESDESEATQSLYGSDSKDTNDATRSMFGDDSVKNVRAQAQDEIKNSYQEHDLDSGSLSKLTAPKDKKTRGEEPDVLKVGKENVAFISKEKSEMENAPSITESALEENGLKEGEKATDVHTPGDEFELTRSMLGLDGSDIYDATHSMFTDSRDIGRHQSVSNDLEKAEDGQESTTTVLNEKKEQDRLEEQAGHQSSETSEEIIDSLHVVLPSSENTGDDSSLSTEKMPSEEIRKDDSKTRSSSIEGDEPEVIATNTFLDAKDSEDKNQSDVFSASATESDQPKDSQETNLNEGDTITEDHSGDVKEDAESDVLAIGCNAIANGNLATKAENDNRNAQSKLKNSSKSRLKKGIVISIVALFVIAAIAIPVLLFMGGGESSPVVSASSGDESIAEASKPSTSGQTHISVTNITLNNTHIELYIGQSTILTATISPSNASNNEVTWTTNDPSIAEVDENGGNL